MVGCIGIGIRCITSRGTKANEKCRLLAEKFGTGLEVELPLGGANRHGEDGCETNACGSEREVRRFAPRCGGCCEGVFGFTVLRCLATIAVSWPTPLTAVQDVLLLSEQQP
jgi:hypothetical protein